MLLRGGLLIEPWSSYKLYTNNPQKQSIISYNNNIYVCSVSHQSGATFEENSSKFATIGGGSGGGGPTGDRYVGEWDLSNVTVDIVQAVPSIQRSTGFVKISDSMFNFLGDNAPFFVDSSNQQTYADGVIAESATPINSGVRSAVMYIPEVNMQSAQPNFINVFGILSNNNEIEDIFDLLSNRTPARPISGMFAYCINNFFTDTLVMLIVVVKNSTTIGFGQHQLSSALAPGTPVFYDINTATGETNVTIDNVSYKPNANVFVDVSDFTNDTFTPFLMCLATTPNILQDVVSTFDFDLGTELNSRLPFLSVEEKLIPPANLADGQVYRAVNGSGVYLGSVLEEGNYVEFANNLQQLIVTPIPYTTSQIKMLAQEQINTQPYARIQYINFQQVVDIDITVGTTLAIITTVANTVDPSSLILPAINDALYNGMILRVIATTTATNISITGFNGDAITSVPYNSVFEFIHVDNIWIRTK